MRINNRSGSKIYEDNSATMRDTVLAALAAGADLRSADLQWSGLQLINFDESDLSQVLFAKSNLYGCNFYRCLLEDAVFENTNLIEANFTEAILTRADLNFATLMDSKFIGAHLKKAKLRYADLSNAAVRYAALNDADLTGADLTNADLTGADLRGVNLTGAALTGARFSLAKTARAVFDTDVAGAIDLAAPASDSAPASAHRGRYASPASTTDLHANCEYAGTCVAFLIDSHTSPCR